MSTTNPRITTEWGDIHRKLGNFPALEKEVTNEELTNTVVDAIESTDPLSSVSLKNLNALEEASELRSSLPDELAAYRKKRLLELKLRKKYCKFGEVIHVGKSDFVKEVTEASAETIESGSSDASSDRQDTTTSKGTWVVVHVFADSQPFCILFNRILVTLAAKFAFVKFVKGYGKDIIPNYPEQNTPVVLLYKNGECVKQIFGIKPWNGLNVTADYVEYILGKIYKIFPTDIDENPCEDENRSSSSKIHAPSLSTSTFNASKQKYRNDEEDSASDDDMDQNYLSSDRSYSRLSLDKLNRFK